MNPFEFVIALVVITTIGSIIKAKQAAKYGLPSRRDRRRDRGLSVRAGIVHLDEDEDGVSGETLRLREEVAMLKERLHTLERITVDKESSLSREIDSLRDR